MGFDTTIQQNDVGITVIVIFDQDDGITPQNISAAESTIIYITRPDCSVITGNATFVTDGSDGQIQYVSQPGDFSLIGIYRIKGYATFSGNGVLYTRQGNFIVMPSE